MTQHRDLDLGLWSAGGEEQLFAFDRERRMHALAYDHWVALLAGRPMPALDDLDPARLGGFTGNCVLIELGGAGMPPAISFVGQKLRAQADVGPTRDALDEVREDALLATLLRHLPEMVALGAPAQFEIERDGAATALLHRGILLPFSDRSGALRAILGVISWSAMVSVDQAPDIASAVGSVLAAVPPPPAASPWAADSTEAASRDEIPPRSLDRRLAAAQTWAALAAGDRSAAASLHAALSATYDLLLAARAQGAEPMSSAEAVIASVFGSTAQRTDRQRYAATLDHAARLGLGPGRLAPLLDRTPGGHSALAAAERNAQGLGSADAIGRIASERMEKPATIRPVDPDFLRFIGRRDGRVAGAATPAPKDLRHVG